MRKANVAKVSKMKTAGAVVHRMLRNMSDVYVGSMSPRDANLESAAVGKLLKATERKLREKESV